MHYDELYSEADPKLKIPLERFIALKDTDNHK
jgi:hypothetical protein